MKKIFAVLFAAAFSCALLPFSPTAAASHPQDRFVPIIKKAVPSVVKVETFATPNADADVHPMLRMLPQNSPYRKLMPQNDGKVAPEKQPIGVGSGFVVHADGYIVTNGHVVKNAKTVEVIFADEARLEARIVGTHDAVDLALLKVDKNARKLIPLVLGDSDAVEAGEGIIAIGNPFGSGIAASAGIISAKRRELSSPIRFIQTDAAINPGNSGGPLLNAHGEVIGLNTLILSPSGANAGVGLATPSRLIQIVTDELRMYGKFRSRWLGILPANENGPVTVERVTPGSPAAISGLVAGDTIVSFGGERIRTARDLVAVMFLTRIGEEVPMKIMREGREREFLIKIQEIPQSANPPRTSPHN